MNVALVGEPAATGFAAKRFRHFQRVLQAAGHEVLPIDARAPVPCPGAQVVVSAGVYAPTAAAVDLAGERPLWIDLPGDPFADAQAVVARGGDPDAVAQDCARVFLPALARADAFSTIGAASRWTLVGQLGLLGRFAGPDDLPIHPVPIAWPVEDELPHRGAASGSLRVLLAGSFNTWFDEDAVADVLLDAMRRTRVEVDVLGGPGQPGGYDAFVRRMQGHPVRFHGWVADPAPVYAQCEVLLTLDRPGTWEPMTGSRTRVLTALAAGLRVVASAGPELVDELAEGGHVAAVRTRGEALAALLDRAPPPPVGALASRYDGTALLRPLLEWLDRPRRARPAAVAGALDHALAGRKRAEAELAAIRATWAFRLGDLRPSSLRRR